MIIPDSFKCPKGEGECEVFGGTTWYCPYAAFPLLDERRFNEDCKFAPPEMWRDFKNHQERIDFWMTEGA